MAFETQNWNNLYDRDNREDFRLAYAASQGVFPFLAAQNPFNNELTFDYDHWTSGDTALIKDMRATSVLFFSRMQRWIMRFQNYFSPGATADDRWEWFCKNTGLSADGEWGFRHAHDLNVDGEPDIVRFSERRYVGRIDYIGPWLLEDLALGFDGLQEVSWSSSLTPSVSVSWDTVLSLLSPGSASASASASGSDESLPSVPSASVSGPPSVPVTEPTDPTAVG